MFKIAEAFVQVTADGKKAARDFADDMGASPDGTRAGESFGKKLLLGVAALGIGAAVAGYLKSSINAASDLNETVSKSKAIFGDDADSMLAWSKTAAKTLGLSSSAALNAATSFGDMLSQIGFTGKEASTMSKSVVKAAADLGSFSNLDTADVSDRISAAFRGEYDSLQAVIPNISAARVESEAMAATGKKTAAALTAQEKATAVMAIVTKDGARAMGDFERTSGGLANQLKIAAAQSEDLKTKFGDALLPAAVAVATGLNTYVLPALSTFADWVGPKISAAMDIGMASIKSLGEEHSSFYDAVMSTDVGAAIVKSFPELERIAGVVWGILSGPLWNSVESIAGSLARAADATGASTWGLLMGAFNLLAPVAQGVSDILFQIARLMDDNPALVENLLVAYTAWRVGLALTEGAQWALNAAVSANPYVIAIAGIIAVIGYFVWLSQNYQTAIKWEQNLASSIVSGTQTALGAFSSFAAGGVAAVVSVVAWWMTLPIRIGNALHVLTSMMSDVGHNMMAGLGAGIVNGVGSAIRSAIQAANQVVSAVKNALGIHSPSKVMADEVGVFLPAGIGEGIDDGAPALNRKIRNLVTIPTVPGSSFDLTSSSPSSRGGDSPVIIQSVTIDASNVEDFARVVAIFKELGQTARAGRNLQIG